MSTVQSELFPPPTRAKATDEKGFLSIPLRQWLFTLQMIAPLRVGNTAGGGYSEALPPAGLNSTTGQSNQNQEIIYVKISADANNWVITGALTGTVTLSAQYAVARFKSDGTSWYAVCCGSGGGGGTLALEVNGVPNGSQTLLNLFAGANVTLTDNGTGKVTIAASGGGGGGGATVPYFWSNGETVPWDDFYSGPSLNDGLLPVTAEVYKVILPFNCTVNQFSFGYYSGAGELGWQIIFGLYDASKNLVLDSGALAIPANPTASDVSGSLITSLGAPVVIAAGTYYFLQGFVAGSPSIFNSQVFGWSGPWQSQNFANIFRTPMQMLMDMDNAGAAPALITLATDLSGGVLPATLPAGTPIVAAPSGGYLAVLFHG